MKNLMCLVVSVVVAGVLYSGCIEEAQAQCNGIFPNGTFCGNLSGANAPAGPIALNTGSIVGPGTTVVDDIVTWNNAIGTLLKDSGISLGSQAQNLFLATPSGGAGVPAFRALASADLAALGLVTCSASGAFPVGTGAGAQCSTVSAAIANLSGPLTITPVANTYTQALNTQQSSPTSGSTTVTTGEKFNSISGSHNATITCAANTDPFADFGYWCNAVTLLKVGLTTGGVNLGAGPGAAGGTISPIVGHIVFNSNANTINDFVGSTAVAYASATNSGAGGLFGFASETMCDGCNFSGPFVGYEMDLMIRSAGVVPQRYGLHVINQGGIQATGNDAVLRVGSTNSAGGFKTGLEFGTNTLDVAANILLFEGAVTVANVLNLNNLTVSGNIINHTNVTLSGAGALAILSTFTETINQNNSTSATVNNNSGGTSATSSWVASNGTGSGSFGVGGTGYTGSGGILQNRAYVVANSGSAGITLDAQAAAGSGTIKLAIGNANVVSLDGGNPFAGPTELTITNSNSGTTSLAGYVASVGSPQATFGVGSAAFTSPTILQNSGFVFSNANTSGLVLDAAGAAKPIILATNDTEAARVLLGFMVGTTTDPGAGIINVLTGFRIGNAATTGNVLRGNGTNFVSAALASTDLSDSGAWANFTPSLSCATATFTVNSARSKTIMSKTTFWELDFTITAIGTCSNSVTFTAPTTSNVNAETVGQEISVNGESIGCRVTTGSTTVVCVKRLAVNFLVNERYVITGLYEVQ